MRMQHESPFLDEEALQLLQPVDHHEGPPLQPLEAGPLSEAELLTETETEARRPARYPMARQQRKVEDFEAINEGEEEEASEADLLPPPEGEEAFAATDMEDVPLAAEDEASDLYLAAAAGELAGEESQALVRETEDEDRDRLHREQPDQAGPDPTRKPLPSFRVEERGNGRAWLQINQELPWPTALWILQIMKLAGPGSERDLHHRDVTSMYGRQPP